MTVQLSVSARNGALDAFETAAGATAELTIWSGAQPADCATANSGTELVTMTLPADWMAAAATGTKAKSGTWSGTAVGVGTAGHFRIYDSTGTTCHLQGAVAISASDLNLDNTSIAVGQTVTISTFTLTAGNA